MPGAFIHDESNDVSPPISPDLQDGKAGELVDQELLQGFNKKQDLMKKTIRQSHLINQLDRLVYILVTYQFVKYCHLASLFPVLGHIIVQKLLSCEEFTGKESGFFNLLVILRKFNDEANGDADVIRSLNRMVSHFCSVIYLKSLIMIVSHILFITLWLLPLADQGQLKNISNGSWWFVSFVGEYRDIGNWGLLSYISKLVHLGLVGLVVSDLLILFIQLTLFQAIFKQCPSSPSGEELSDETMNLRTKGDVSANYNNDEVIPITLKVKLYDTMSTSFLSETT